MDFSKFDKGVVGEELYLKLTNDQAGRLIGFGGKTIKDLLKRFDGVKIVVNSSGQRLVKISGKYRVNVYGLILTQIM
jgi:hypothetical protein